MPNTVYVEYANRAFSQTNENYVRLMQSIIDYPEPNHESFKVEMYKSSEQGSNTHLLFLYGYKISINLTLVYESDYEYLGEISCCLGENVIANYYIEGNGDLTTNKMPDYPKDYLGECGKPNTTKKFLTTIAHQILLGDHSTAN